jgi:aspartate aminotransferase-like enzyme
VITGLARVLVVAAGLDALGLDVFAVKHQNVGFVVVHPDHGVESAHKVLEGLKNQWGFSAAAWQATQRKALG